MISLIYVSSQAIDGLLDSGNYIGALIQIFSESMGQPQFLGLIFLGLSAVMYMRYQSIIPVFILGLLLFGVFQLAIPTNVMGLVLLLMSIAGGIILFSLVVRRQTTR